MKTLLKKALGMAALTLVTLCANAQTPALELKHFSQRGLSLDYPANMKFEDLSESGGQSVELTHEGKGAQIIVLARYDVIDSQEKLATARKDVYDFYVSSMVRVFEKENAKVARFEKQVDVGGAQATGVRLRCVVDGESGNAEVYAVVLGRRLVLVSFIGSDEELEKAASSWNIVRRSIKVDQDPNAIPATPADTPDFGIVTGSTYANKYFGLTLTIPAGWNVQDADLKKQMSEKGKELVTSDNPTTKGQLNRAIENTLNLLTITEHPIGSPAPSNAMFVCGSEPPSGAKSDATYMSAVKNTLKYSQVPITILKDVYSEQIGGVAFSAMDIETDYSGVIVSQKYYAHIVKDRVLFFIVIYRTPEQLKTLTETLKSVKLQ